MPRPRKWPPSVITKHNREYVRIQGRDWPLGPAGSERARREYARLVAQAAQGTLGKSQSDLSVLEAAVAFQEHARARYESGEAGNFTYALRPLVELFGDELVADFRPKKLKEVRAKLGKLYCRSLANRHLVRVRTMFRWLESEELAPAGLYDSLLTVAGLRPGEARESAPVLPVPEDALAATLPHCNPVVRSAVEVQLLTAARPGEVLRLRPCDLLREGRAQVAPGVALELGAVWAAPLSRHKTAHRGKSRVLLFGPKAQAALAPWLAGRAAGDHLFSPREAYLLHCAGAGRDPGRLLDTLGGRYTTGAYRDAIGAACGRAFPPPAYLRPREGERWRDWKRRLSPALHAELKAWRKAHRWHPNQLRHLAATRVREEFGIELARVVLGHSSADTTAIYALDNLKAAAEAMGKVG